MRYWVRKTVYGRALSWNKKSSIEDVAPFCFGLRDSVNDDDKIQSAVMQWLVQRVVDFDVNVIQKLVGSQDKCFNIREIMPKNSLKSSLSFKNNFLRPLFF